MNLSKSEILPAKPFHLLLMGMLPILFSGCSKNDPPVQLAITGFSPEVGNTGTPVTISGSGFSPTLAGNTVNFNGTPAEVVVATAASLVALAPKNVTTGKISVSANGKTVASSFDFVEVVTVITLAGSVPPGYLNGPVSSAKFYAPSGIGVTPSGTIFVSEEVNLSVRMIAPDGTVSTFAGSPSAGYVDGDGSLARFRSPNQLCLDATGNIYLSDVTNNCVRKISPSRVVGTLAGNQASAGYLDGQGTAAKFNAPAGIAIDNAGNVFLADFLNNRIRKISPTGAVTTFAGNGTAGSTDGSGLSARFSSPCGVTIDPAGNLFVTECGGNRIRKITPAGTVTTFAGSGVAGFADGMASIAQFNTPIAIAIDATGNFFVADFENHSIRKVSSTGQVTTLAGSKPSGFVNGTSDVAKFNHPVAIAIDGSGNLLVADRENHSIRLIAQ